MYNVILPTYNEADNIVILIKMLEDVFLRMSTNYKLIVVDDNSTDNTAEIVRRLKSSKIVLLSRPGKLGLGTAYAAALQECTFKYTVIMDADLQHDPEAIIDMSTTIRKGYDVVSGTRYTNGGKVCGWPFKRCLVSSCANNLARYILGLKSTDLTGSFRIYKTSILRKLIESVFSQGFGFQMEALARAEASRYKIAELPIVFYDRNTGESKISIYEIAHFLMIVIRLYVRI